MAKAKIGLALGGGAARGWAHIGVLKALVEAGIKPDIIVGTSIGAVVGACHAAGHLDALEEFARDLTRRRIFGYLDFNFAGTALINGQRLCDRLESHLGHLHIEELDPRFTAVATELGTGHEIWLSRGRLADAVRASYALPGIFRPVKINGRWLFDGALVNPIPVSVARAHGARYVIAVNLNFDVCGRGTIVPHLEPDVSAEAEADAPPVNGKNGSAMRNLLKRQVLGKSEAVPGISTVMVEAFNIVQDRIARSRLAGDPPDAMINLRLSDIGLFDFHRAEELIRRGEDAAKRHLSEMHREIDARRHAPGAHTGIVPLA
ncbi:MAG: patatin-like phospholipase family protein [Hyphomicrobium sp.]|uniref:patatin-like phospholipase family protein n=1 Tax=Hyphomicrobium sp. TaxID=82 RepID=UPI00132B6F9D|nr:patatin-like phospholipase family protein [Hyphomicrobium sp.]KAB2939527.1 MAG: NTE family protein rssA [Hyphomicrobium sp.]MBZ0210084.1 patatin-like phospholipase family protein [Hyphomicrobium sp.]MCZ7593546.1 patatin-like phospholipase family protein [Hyphomicrobium sp.]